MAQTTQITVSILKIVASSYILARFLIVVKREGDVWSAIHSIRKVVFGD